MFAAPSGHGASVPAAGREPEPAQAATLGNELDHPHDFALTLVYEGREPLTLPLYGATNRGRATATLYAFFPALLADLRLP